MRMWLGSSDANAIFLFLEGVLHRNAPEPPIDKETRKLILTPFCHALLLKLSIELKYLNVHYYVILLPRTSPTYFDPQKPSSHVFLTVVWMSPNITVKKQ